MTAQLAPFPDLDTLIARLNALGADHGLVPGPVTVLSREENFYASTFPSEVVTCRLADGQERRLLCKYAAGKNHNAHGHRGGVAHEAEVYRRVLRPLGVALPRCYGASEGTRTEEAWLILDFLDAGVRLCHIGETEAVYHVVNWLGRFHAAAGAWLAQGSRPGLPVYDRSYYEGWVRRALHVVGTRPDGLWLRSSCARWEQALEPLLIAPTVIHGEFYPHNILVQGGVVCPVDWESAAVAAGEIDLAAVTEDWPEEYVQECCRVYRRARWPTGAPADFERTGQAAQLYLVFRWLGDEREMTSPGAVEWCLKRLRATSERLGLT
jgi:hypothetical protein